MIQPFERAFHKITGEIRVVFSQKEDKYINAQPLLFRRKETYKENLKIIKDCYSDYKIISSFESDNYHKFYIYFDIFKLYKTVIINRTNGHIEELTNENEYLIKDEDFTKLS